MATICGKRFLHYDNYAVCHVYEHGTKEERDFVHKMHILERNAAQNFINRTFAPIPQDVIKKLWEFSDYNDFENITIPVRPSVGDYIPSLDTSVKHVIGRAVGLEDGTTYADYEELPAPECTDGYFPMWGDNVVGKRWLVE